MLVLLVLCCPSKQVKMNVWECFVVVIALTSVGGEARTVLETARTANHQPHQTGSRNDSTNLGAVQTDNLDEPINQTEVRNASTNLDAVQRDNLNEPIIQTEVRNASSEVDQIQDPVLAALTRALKIKIALHGLNRTHYLEQLTQQLTTLFNLSRSNSEPASRRVKRSVDEGMYPGLKPMGFISGRLMRYVDMKYPENKPGLFDSRRMKRSDDMVEEYPSQRPKILNTRRVKRSDVKVPQYPWQDPSLFSNPLLLITDALYQLAQQTAIEIFDIFSLKKPLPETLDELNSLSNDEIRALSYQHLPFMDRTMNLFRSMREGFMFAVAPEQRDSRLEGFWTWFRWFFSPDIIINFLLNLTQGTRYYSIPSFYEAFNTNPGGDLRDTVTAIRVAILGS